MTFLNLLNEDLQKKWSFPSTMPIQDQMIPALIEGKDVVAESPTGTGKTLAYLLPLLQKVDGTKKATQALIIAPSQELCMQIVEVIREWIAGTPITVVPLIGGANPQRQIEKLKKKPTIAVGTPGRLNELVNERKLKLHELTTIILDEGDQLLSRDYRVIVKSFIDGADHNRQVAVVSATITDEIELVAKRMLHDPIRLQVEVEKDLLGDSKVVHSFVKLEQRDKTEFLRKISHISGVRALAFINNLDQLLMKKSKLDFRNAPIVALHSEMKKEERKTSLDSFRKGEARVLIATDIAARGLDIKGLTHVIHVDVPYTKEQYVHRSGRTGRAGADGEVITLLAYHEEQAYHKRMRELSIKPVEKIWSNGQLIEGHAEVKPPKQKRGNNKSSGSYSKKKSESSSFGNSFKKQENKKFFSKKNRLNNKKK
ncbi:MULTISPECIES: DEAD/DEAH box helicase [unclassified Rummeliibacillus]|uniref:DEAD/DEAH box helicase n=1 Tax=unclassified Rummeliibacillus TaxID=2622809 RepID=UPI000E673B28|nr:MULTISPECIES: DEAD/DEAH box helicase [unclassified Rummeliibacillus]RIJ68865.1 DEAD/DEAH box helicase [Rummeliibacillus sp. POC4]RPJ95922.1 DEAD/DEAH box helicase [Rummeliibacillus sp. TYF005]